jgi:hypothetical protein
MTFDQLSKGKFVLPHRTKTKTFVFDRGNIKTFPWSRTLLEKLVVAQLINTFQNLYGR